MTAHPARWPLILLLAIAACIVVAFLIVASCPARAASNPALYRAEMIPEGRR